MNISKKLTQKIILDLVYLLIKEVKGVNNIPKYGKYIVASNHASFIDPFTIGSVIFKRYGKIIHYVGKKEASNYFFFRFIYRTFDVVPIDLSSKSKNPLIKAIKILKNNKIVGIFPEGSRTMDGKIHAGKIGVARLTISSHSPILPVAIKNTFMLWPKGKKLPKVKKIIRINIGKPLRFSHYQNKRVSKKNLRKITNLIMEKINKLYSELN